MEGILIQLALFTGAWSSASADAPRPPLVAWEELRDAPERFLGRRVQVFTQFESTLADWEPYQTRFSPHGFLSLRAWSDEQLPWLESDYQSPAATLFVRRGTRLERVAGRWRPHDRLALVAVVRSAHLGRPWVEVVGAQRARRFVPEGTVLHAEKALELVDRGALDLARDQLDRALAAPLPARARSVLEELSRACEAAVRKR